MKYCSKCGKKIMDEAVLCVHCNQFVESQRTDKVPAKNKKRITTKTIIFIVLAAILLIGATTGGFLIWDYTRKEAVKEELKGKLFVYYDQGFTFSQYNQMSFDENGVLTVYSLYSYVSGDEDDREFKYKDDYNIVFKDDKVFLDRGDSNAERLYEVIYNAYGNIVALYDTKFNHKYT